MEKLTGTLVYVQVQKPTKCYVESKGSEYKASIVVDEDTADAWDDAFPKQSAKQVKTSEFKNIYKIDPPFPEQKKQYIITVRKNTALANGEMVPTKYQPKVYQRKGDVLVDITQSVLPANGSEGQISLEVYEGKMGTFARLKNVLVTNLIEYEGAGGEEPGSEFGIPVAKSKNNTPDDEPEEQPKAKPQAKSSKKPPVEPEDDIGDDLPFN